MLLGEGVTAVAIYRLLQKSVFGPEDIKRLAKAYESALRALELSDRNDPITELLPDGLLKQRKPGSAIRTRSEVLSLDWERIAASSP